MVKIKTLIFAEKFKDINVTEVTYYSPSKNEIYVWNNIYPACWNPEEIPSDLRIVSFRETISYYRGRCYVDHIYNYYCNCNEKYQGAPKPLEVDSGPFGCYTKEKEMTELASSLGMTHAYKIRYEWDSSD